jgi:hypothetical protein
MSPQARPNKISRSTHLIDAGSQCEPLAKREADARVALQRSFFGKTLLALKVLVWKKNRGIDETRSRGRGKTKVRRPNTLAGAQCWSHRTSYIVLGDERHNLCAQKQVILRIRAVLSPGGHANHGGLATLPRDFSFFIDCGKRWQGGLVGGPGMTKGVWQLKAPSAYRSAL